MSCGRTASVKSPFSSFPRHAKMVTLRWGRMAALRGNGSATLCGAGASVGCRGGAITPIHTLNVPPKYFAATNTLWHDNGNSEHVSTGCVEASPVAQNMDVVASIWRSPCCRCVGAHTPACIAIPVRFHSSAFFSTVQHRDIKNFYEHNFHPKTRVNSSAAHAHTAESCKVGSSSDKMLVETCAHFTVTPRFKTAALWRYHLETSPCFAALDSTFAHTDCRR